MRLKKAFFFIIIIMCLLLTTAYINRSSLVILSINHFLNSDETKINCLDFNVDRQLNIAVSKLCLTTPIAELTLSNAQVHWQFSSTSPIKVINVKQLDIYGTKTILTPPKNDESSTPFGMEPWLAHLDQLANIDIPFQLTVEQFTYQPYTPQKPAKKHNYIGDLQLKNNNLMVNFMSNAKTNILAATLTTKQKELSGHIEINLPEIMGFVAAHPLDLPSTIQAFNINQGILKSKFSWQHQTLTLQPSLAKFACHCTLTTPHNKITTDILADLQWQTIITKTDIQHTWQEGSQITFAYEKPAFIELLQAQNTSQELITLLSHNLQQQINITPVRDMHFDMVQQQLYIAELNIEIPNETQVNTLSFTDLYLQPSESNEDVPVSLQAKYQLNSQLIVPMLNTFTTQPITLNAIGSFEKSIETFTINIDQSATTASNIMISHDDEASKSETKIKAAEISNELSGRIDLSVQTKPTFNFTINTNMRSLYANNIAKVNNLTLASTLNGKLNNFTFTSQINTDNLLLAQVAMTGSTHKTNFTLQASQLAMTDLLNLKITLPVEVELIDGALNYDISGSITDFAIPSLVANIHLSLSDLTGEIDGTWLQGVNWEQILRFSNSELMTPTSNKNIFSVDLIETPSPISSLTAHTNISYQADELHTDITDIEANILGGSFKIAKVIWPMPTLYSANIQLTDIDLEQVLALDKKQGIVVTGRVSGELPLTLNNEKLIMAEGRLENSTPGLIQVMNNPAVEELKAQNSQLKLAFDALQNLHYHQLSSEVSMIDDGYMLLETVIKGKNPDLDNDVNLNLNLSYDLLGLLESLSITERFEKSIVESLNKP